ncbi:MAG TPA: HAMP domain-containing sensor histidine kinase [Ignavibacteria bacterium]|nr:HAMP domain-containing sensor histidine kinase [Ignavibacteria bacterium]
MNKFGSLNIKIAFIIAGVLIAFVVLYYTQTLAQKIQKREKDIAQLYAKSMEYLANDDNSAGEYGFIFDQIIPQIDFPIIATDKDKKEITLTQNVEYDTTLSPAKKNEKLFQIAREMDEINPPIVVSYKDSVILNYIHYGQSSVVTQLKLLPLYELIAAGVFIILGYVGFSNIKKNEQSNIWVGLTRETAHQLGTPLTSLMGWAEMLKNIEPQTEDLKEITGEISKDLEKLKKIAGRFSKIGSKPKLENENINNVITKVSDYFEKRIPTLVSADGIATKKVQIDIKSKRDYRADINIDLFEWVIENLIKNAIDAMVKPKGKIVFNLSDKNEELIIDVSDNGKGIDTKFKKDVFRPGYSTKTRGWGLGLSLSKRIIEDYHKGKLMLLESSSGKGTIFRIKLSKSQAH